MKVLIIEDEKFAQDKLQRILLQLEPNIEILAKIESVQRAVEWLQHNTADLIFMDIHLADGSSFRIFELVDFSTPVIFTTAYDEYAIKAFKVNSIDYLTKPITKYDLKKAIDKFKERTLHENNVKVLLEKISKQEKPYKERFLLNERDQVITITTNNIAYFFADGKYVFLIDNEGVQHIVDYTIEKLTSILNPSDFFRINRKFIISYQSILRMTTYTKGRLKLQLINYNEEVTVSSERSKDFKLWFDR